MRISNFSKRIITALLLFAVLACYIVPVTARAEETDQKVVRVGWYDSSFNYYDQFGRRCGIDYEYQQRISAYTGWTYEYVEGSWATLLQMLIDGEIDLLGDVSYKEEREELMLYPDLPMGTESYYIYVNAKNTEITSDNLSSFNGKRVGVNKGSIQEGFLKEWAEKKNIDIEIVPVLVEENEAMNMIMNGELDGYASVYTMYADQKAIPVCRIGGSDYFYAVKKDRKDLLDELNVALAGIQEDDPYFNQRLTEERLYNSKTNISLTAIQEEWLKNHSTIRVGYRDNYLPFCDTDDKTGELIGALKDYLVHADNNLNLDIKFETKAYESTEAAIKAMKDGEVDCVFPVYLSTYDAEQMGIRLTSPAMKSEMNVVRRISDDSVLSQESQIIIAVDEGNLNIETFVKDIYPRAKIEKYKNKNACFKAVSDGKADCALISSYRLSRNDETLKKYKVFSVPTGESVQFSFAVGRNDTELYFFLNKTVAMTTADDMDAALVSYMRADEKVTFLEFMKDNMIAVIAIIIVVFSLVIFLLAQKMKAERVANRQKVLLAEAEEIADLKQTISSLLDNMPGINFTKDAGTSKYLACNQAFAEYVHKKDPSEVVGHTTREIFDEAMVKSSEEDDQIALSMEGPYVYFDELPDADGVKRQVKVTKMKYTDANGKLCLLGMYQDVTDSFRISRNNARDKESYEKARSSGVIFTHIAQTLARGYVALYYVDLNTEEFIEFSTDAETGSLVEANRGWHFFEECLDEIDEYVYKDDTDAVTEAMDRRTLVAELDKNDTFMMTFRIKGKKEPQYVSMKVTRMQDDERYIILGITDVNEQMKEHNVATKLREEQTAYNRITALAGEFLFIWVVNPENGHYREFSTANGFEAIDRFVEGQDFFADSREKAQKLLYPDDIDRFVSGLTRENVLGEVESNGIYTLSYRLLKDGEPRYVQLKAAIVVEDEGARLIVGINDIDAQVRQEEEYGRRLAQARIEANIDALTGVKNRNAYRVYEDRLNAQIELERSPEFAITILDVNDLKKVNDTQGHKAGDQFLRDACKIICAIFKRSPVFRVGGDEFAVLSQGDDYERIEELIGQMNRHNKEALENGGVVIAVGMARYMGDPNVAPVYERADKYMYDNKSELKARKKQRG